MGIRGGNGYRGRRVNWMLDVAGDAVCGFGTEAVGADVGPGCC